MNKLILRYIDDNPELYLDRFLARELVIDSYEVDYQSIRFDSKEGYTALLNRQDIQTANVIIIDSKLFENVTFSDKSFSGEELKIILKKIYPFIEVIVITQNEDNIDLGVISKFKSRISGGRDQAIEYYRDTLQPLIQTAAKNILVYQNIAAKLAENECFDPVIKEKVLNSISGQTIYDDLTKNDIDDLIAAFKEIEANF